MVLPIGDKIPQVHCAVFEDNKSCIELVTCPKMRPRTKIGLKYQHLGSNVKEGFISVKYRNTENQIADLLTKPLGEVHFLRLRKDINGW